MASPTKESIDALPSYRAMWLSVRPARVAVFIPEINGWGWHCVRKTHEILSRIWGGAGDILVPITPKGIPEPFWRLLKAFDADSLAAYSPTKRDLKEASHSDFDKRIAAQTAQMLDNDFTPEEAARELASDAYLDSHFFDGFLTKAETERISRELSPACDPEKIRPHWLQMNKGAYYGLADMTAFTALDRERLTVLDPSNLDEELALMLADRVGLLSPSYADALQKSGSRVDLHGVAPEAVEQVIEVITRGYTEPDKREIERRLARHMGQAPTTEPKWSGRKHQNRFLLSKTEYACFWGARTYFDHRQPFTVVIGDALQDYCLANCLHRLTGKCVWLPHKYATGADQLSMRIKRTLMQEIADLVEHQPKELGCYVTSISIPQHDLKETYKAWEASVAEPYRLHAEATLPDDIPLVDVRRLYHREQVSISRLEPFIGDRMAGWVETPIPRDCAEHAPQAVTWYVDVGFDNHKLPARTCLGRIVLEDGTGHLRDVRCSSAGLSYFSHRILTHSGARIDQNVQRPRLRCPDALEVFRSLLARSGMSADVSSAGAYSIACYRLFGSLGAFAGAVANKNTNALLEAYIQSQPTKRLDQSQDVDSTRPVFLRGVGRTFLTLQGIMKVSGLDESSARALIDDWLGRGILSRGVILRCPLCGYAAWYAVGDFSANFRCQRCREASRMVQGTWKKPVGEPWWYYELSEVVHQAIDKNARVPALALHKLSERKEAFLHAPELEVTFQDGKKTEVDIWAIVGGRVILGEATSTGVLGKTDREEEERLERLSGIVDAATADELVFATTRDEWNQATKRAIEAKFPKSRVQVHFMEKLGG